MVDRRLAAVMVTDMVGFTVLMGADQRNALELLDRGHEILKDIVSRHRGEWLDDAGDRSLTAFPSSIDAVNCALEIQTRIRDEPEIELRIGVDVGDIVITGGHAYGDPVNIASFIERLADPQGLVITESVYETIRGHVDLNVIDLGEKMLKNIDHAVRLYALTGARRRSAIRNFFSALLSRRVLPITGAYLAASWAVVEVTEWLAAHDAFGREWVYATIVGLLAVVPSVAIITYLHGAHGKERLTRLEKVFVPANILIAALAAVYTLNTVDVTRNTSPPIEPASVAVLPFANLSGDESNDYFGVGLSEELINALAKVPGLYVASRTSSFAFDDDVDPRTVAENLRVATILEGSVRKHGDDVRITAQLIDGKNNYHLWSETYDRQLADIFQIQEDIAAAVALELVGVLKPKVFEVFADARAATIDSYDLYLRGLYYLRQPISDESLEIARGFFDRALIDDSEYARAYAGLCEVSLQEYLLFRSPSRIDEAKTDCLHALELEADAREVQLALGELNRHTGDYEASARIFEQLLEKGPLASAWTGLGLTRYETGDIAGAEASFANAIVREPGTWQHRLAYARVLYRQGRYEDALEQLQRVIELSPDNARAYLLMGAAYDYLGYPDESLQATLRSLEIEPTRAGYRDLGITYYFLGNYEKAAEAYKRAVELGPQDHWSWGSLALIYSIQGDKEVAGRAAYDRAILLAEAVLERNPRDWVTLSRLALYNVMNGAVDLGLARITTAVSEGTHLADVNYHDAIIRWQLGQREQALDAIERAIATGAAPRMIATDPQFVALRSDDRFRRLVAKQPEE